MKENRNEEFDNQDLNTQDNDQCFQEWNNSEEFYYSDKNDKDVKSKLNTNKLIVGGVITAVAIVVLISVIISLLGRKNNADHSGDNFGENNSSHVCNFTRKDKLQNRTCTQDGIIIYMCECGESKVEIKEATGHNYDEWKTITESTCAHGGELERTCVTCNEEERAYTDKLQHIYSATDEIINGALTKNYTCDICSDNFLVASNCFEGFVGLVCSILF